MGEHKHSQFATVYDVILAQSLPCINSNPEQAKSSLIEKEKCELNSEINFLNP